MENDGQQPDEAELIFAQLEQERANAVRETWRFRYGFDHTCVCGEDFEAGELVEITKCYSGATVQAFDELARARAFLYAIATSPSKNYSVLKQLAGEAFVL